MNQYKIDLNSYLSSSYPYALYVKRGRWSKWKHLESYKTVDEAKEARSKLEPLPIFL